MRGVAPVRGVVGFGRTQDLSSWAKLGRPAGAGELGCGG
jgi:hypothetical protein